MNVSYPAESDSGGYSTYFQPLTTIFTPPARCYTVATEYGVGTFEVFGSPTSTRTDPTPCLPSEVSSTVQLINLLTTWRLGPFTCPHAYTQISSQVSSETSTLTMCCPSGYAASPAGTTTGTTMRQVCTSILPAGVTFESNIAGILFDTVVKQTPVTFRATALSGWNIGRQVASATATATSVISTSGGSSNDSGTKIGLGVGISVGVVLLAAVIVWFFLRSRKKQRLSVEPVQQSNAFDPGPMDYKISNHDIVRPTERYQGASMSELSTYRSPVELHSASRLPDAELPSSTAGR